MRALFGLVLQDVHLFSGTIGANIRLGEARLGDDDGGRAAAARARRPVHRRSCRRASTTVLGERGATLSVGQKQLLSFARALAFDRPVLVLDEATSSVDTETEIVIREALEVLMRGRTTVAIAHRLSTIQDMDQILVLHKGVLRESGTHQALLAQRGIYFKLYQLQFRDTAGNHSEFGVRSAERGRVPGCECRNRVEFPRRRPPSRNCRQPGGNEDGTGELCGLEGGGDGAGTMSGSVAGGTCDGSGAGTGAVASLRRNRRSMIPASSPADSTRAGAPRSRRRNGRRPAPRCSSTCRGRGDGRSPPGRCP